MVNCTGCNCFLPSWEQHEKCFKCTELAFLCTDNDTCTICLSRVREEWQKARVYFKDLVQKNAKDLDEKIPNCVGSVQTQGAERASCSPSPEAG